MRKSELVVLAFALLNLWCTDRQPASATKGELTIEVDESIVRVINMIADSFQRTYTESKVQIRSVQAREATVNFVNDSARVIVIARELNEDEAAELKRFNVEYRPYKCAFDAIAVVGHKNNPQKELRLTELDSIFSGELTRWAPNRKLIDVAIGDINSSVNETFKNRILKSKTFTPAAMKFSSSDSLVRYVEGNPNAIGIVGIHWTRGREEKLTIFALGQPGERPDSTEEYGRYYTPHQAHIYRKFYPLWRNVYIYSREIGLIAAGFITYTTRTHGQQTFLNEGFVPATQPIRLVETTRRQVQ